MLSWTLPLAFDRMLADCAATPEEARTEYRLARADVIDTGEGYQVVVELPGVSRDQLTIDLEDGTLTIRGERSPAPQGRVLVNGRGSDRPLVRRFTVGTDIDREHVVARLDQGLLTVTLPRKEEDKPRRIEVQAAS